ncbi:hypothetical protein PHYBLDRAFT_170015 [Phycomyces blakesleeanus NRRL 1555(-)]|uniref:Reverse transcriptase zinc-binding domain-containing protein n=1 Tax=Phycomyces blakesleeanus (strain ATCC 8743b / DSM 1359 / FGSC 10004 / NBRC 33097 / NRRL 1555) TaxID=763407 RepID=A0A163DLF3_PHYB8|nr:hypothetical protein PHYBLDRAFT_170015 [Phycomyces blakesleeanus NRRL 1555(-)]OAD72120.1 hypothetical protein PHYBLDRAFT_170015 [Phycomyces blakesleeanus NRRL 1555(-)]|eukprot:XP_018290160.1 hypothetical protein PHYBLDRAFT_170015 [Phycomyces blakesleeanus NRRL 1555(-)]
MLGDFNYSSYAKASRAGLALRLWLHFVANHFVDCVTLSDAQPMPTFHRDLSSSTIDYIYASKDIASCHSSSTVTFVQPLWTDHCLVRTCLSFPMLSHIGRGLWRANPRLANIPSFRSSLSDCLSSFIPLLSPSISPQSQWDLIKVEVARFTRSYSRTTRPSLATLEIESTCNIHHSRSLSIRGRATVLNSLILSKLWHVLRVVTVPLSFFRRLRSIMSKFRQYRSFPPIPLGTFCQPIRLGGLGVLDPQVQQAALQLRWLRPLVRSPLSPSGLVPPWFSYVLRLDSSSADPLVPLIFPSLQSSHQRDFDSPLATLLAAIDLLPHNFSDVVVNLPTCLSLPLSYLTTAQPDHPPFPSAWRDLRVSDAYEVDPSFGVLAQRPLHRILRRPIVLHRFFERLYTRSLVLHPVLYRATIPPAICAIQFPSLDMPSDTAVDVRPFLTALVPGIPWHRLSTQSFRLLCNFHSKSARPISPTLVPRQLRRFWSFPLLHGARNVWFCALHKNIPCRSRLNSRIPTTFPDPSCALCSHPLDNQTHFLFQCPVKLSVWSSIWTLYFAQTATPTVLLSGLQSFTFPPCTDSSLSAASIFGCTLLAIWRHHWLFIFDHVPFVSSAAFSTASSLLDRLKSELALDFPPL